MHCFVAVAEEGGFNRASARLCKTQPAISYQIKQLEKELGQPLFFRRPRGTELTEAGRILLRHTVELFGLVRRAECDIERLSTGVHGQIRIGTINSVGIHFLPDLLQTMRESYPGARPTILYRDSQEILHALLGHEVELVLMANPPPDPRLRQEVILTEEVPLVCGRSHPFFRRKTVTPEELEGTDFISMSPTSPTGLLVRDYFSRIGIRIEPVVTTDNVETVRKMAEIGLGAAFLPAMVVESSARSQTLALIDVSPPLRRQIVLVSWKTLELSPAANAFVEQLRSHAAAWREQRTLP